MGSGIRPGYTIDPILVSKKAPLCLFIPGTARTEWKYALSLESLWADMKIGCVLNDVGHIIALSRNDAVKAAARMKDTTKNNKAFEKNIYIKGYTQEDQDRLALLWDDFFAMKQ